MQKLKLPEAIGRAASLSNGKPIKIVSSHGEFHVSEEPKEIDFHGALPVNQDENESMTRT